MLIVSMIRSEIHTLCKFSIQKHRTSSAMQTKTIQRTIHLAIEVSVRQIFTCKACGAQAFASRSAALSVIPANMMTSGDALS